MAKILVTGGAGYIGSHMVLMLLDAGHSVVSFDLKTHPALTAAEQIQGDIRSTEAVKKLFKAHNFDAVMHFAAFIEVRLSVKEPGAFYENNVSGALNVLNAMNASGVKAFIFSSTAAIFGEPAYTPIDESHPKKPINPYGTGKWMVEQVLQDLDKAHALKSVCLRYFNAAGADADVRSGESHEPETHLIPLILAAAAGDRDAIHVFGNDYDTTDGTCVRDYIHVTDLCRAHALALEHLLSGGASDQFNLGNGNGYSVQEVISTVEALTGLSVPVVHAPRREGDPAVLVANSSRAEAILAWQPQYDLKTIIQHAWNWYQHD